jgi:hypothetical protein
MDSAVHQPPMHDIQELKTNHSGKHGALGEEVNSIIALYGARLRRLHEAHGKPLLLRSD